jgi:enoyl-CoA hydratase/carnithine racemase
MEFVRLSIEEDLAEVRLERGKVNAIEDRLVVELSTCLRQLADDPRVRGTVLTGTGHFFSFGFDIPHFLGYSKEAFTEYLGRFTALYRELFTHPKPVVAALNGHAVAGGCMLAIACDGRIMSGGKAKIGLNEVAFGSSVFAGSVEMLRFCVGERRAQEILYAGTLYSADEALALGLVDAVATEASLLDQARSAARALAAKDPEAFRSIKQLVRRPVLDAMFAREAASIREFVEIWYSEETRQRLRGIKIHA